MGGVEVMSLAGSEPCSLARTFRDSILPGRDLTGVQFVACDLRGAGLQGDRDMER
jgi:hypothetical protein